MNDPSNTKKHLNNKLTNQKENEMSTNTQKINVSKNKSTNQKEVDMLNNIQNINASNNNIGDNSTQEKKSIDNKSNSIFNAIKLKPAKGVNLKPLLNELKTRFKARYVKDPHEGYIAPMEKKEALEAYFKTLHLDVYFVGVIDLQKGLSIDENTLQNKIASLEVEINQKQRMIDEAIARYNLGRSDTDRIAAFDFLNELPQEATEFEKWLYDAIQILRSFDEELENLRNSLRILKEKKQSNQKGDEVIHKGIPRYITNLEELNKQFSQLEAPGKACVVVDRIHHNLISDKDFIKRLSGFVVVSEMDDLGNVKYVEASKYWQDNCHKHKYNSIVFKTETTTDQEFNLFRGFGVVSQKGDCSLILQHIFEVICASDQEKYNSFLRLLSWQIKNIGTPSRVIVILKSNEQQVGKGVFLQDILGNIYGESGFISNNIDQIIGRFNDNIIGKAYVFLDEALYAGNRSAADAIKSLSTASIMAIETKNAPVIKMPVALNFFLATNHDHCAHIEETDVRYWVLTVSPHRANDVAYFKALFHEIKNGGNQAFLHFLSNLDIGDFSPFSDINKNNEDKKEMIKYSINPYDSRLWLQECAESDCVVGLLSPYSKSPTDWAPWEDGSKIKASDLFEAYKNWQMKLKSPVAPRPCNLSKFSKNLTDLGLEIHKTKICNFRILCDIEILRNSIEKLFKN